MPPAQQDDAEIRQCVLELHDPLLRSDIRVASRLVPLETDLTTPLAYFLDSDEFKEKECDARACSIPTRCSRSKGLYMLEPYDPQPIPVVMVHGLWSSPMTWMEMFNDLRAFPEIRDRYQFWFYLYPTGQPFWASAAQFRETLAEVRQHARSRTTRTRRSTRWCWSATAWAGWCRGCRRSTAATTSGTSSATSRSRSCGPTTRPAAELARVVYFHPNPSVKRVITIGTPHRGSDFANDYTRWLSRR